MTRPPSADLLASGVGDLIGGRVGGRIGERLLRQELLTLGVVPISIPTEAWDQLVKSGGQKSIEELYTDIGLGKRLPSVVARRLLAREDMANDPSGGMALAIDTTVKELGLAALDKAAESLSALKSAASDNRRIAEEAYHLLVEAVRQESAPAAPFFETVVQAKSMLLETEAVRLLAEYQRYTDAHFPASLSDEEIGKLAEAARGHFLPDLLTSYGYWPILRALPSLAAIFGAPLTASSSPTPSPST